MSTEEPVKEVARPRGLMRIIVIAVVIVASLLLFITMFTGKKQSLDRWEGIIFLVLYSVYIGYLIVQG